MGGQVRTPKLSLEGGGQLRTPKLSLADTGGGAPSSDIVTTFALFLMVRLPLDSQQSLDFGRTLVSFLGWPACHYMCFMEYIYTEKLQRKVRNFSMHAKMYNVALAAGGSIKGSQLYQLLQET